MKYSESFEKAVEVSLENNSYLGKGNPNSKILIVGKELAICKENNNIEFIRTVLDNSSDWQKNIDNNIFNIPEWQNDLNLFNPLLPYNGMNLNAQKVGHTWRKYQKLHDLIIENNFDNNNRSYTFYNDMFLTELNDNPSKYSILQPEEGRRVSINDRVENFFTLPFIQKFPIIIMANSHYIRDYNIDICKLFDVEYEGEPRVVNGNSNQWYNLHINEKTPKLVIHTRQLSSDISNDLLKEIAFEVQKFKTKYKIV